MGIVWIILGVFAWILLGFIGFLFTMAGLYRGEEYDWCFREACSGTICVTMPAGPIGLVVGIFVFLSQKINTKGFSKFVHRVINIGIKKK